MSTQPAPSPQKPPRTAAPRAVTITYGEARNGRLPIVVTVVPLADLDAKGGVFVDLRMGARGPDGSARERSSAIDRGDEAVAAMVARETAASTRPSMPAGAEPVSPSEHVAPVDTTAEPTMAAEADPGAEPGHQPSAHQIVSHQIAKSINLTVGQAETFRAEVAVPPASADRAQRWYLRGRFATLGGKDLTSAWLPI